MDKSHASGPFRRRRAQAVICVLVALVVLATGAPPANAVTLPDPTYARTFGTSGNGPGQMDQPSSVAVGPDGTVYVADTGNSDIERFDGATGAFLGEFATVGGAFDHLQYPYGINVDEAGRVWVADTFNNRIVVFNPTGTWIKTFGASGSGNGQFNLPYGVTVADGHVYVADSHNHRIQEFTTAGTFVRTWGSSGTGNGQFNQPQHIDVNRQGELFVADTNNNRVQVFSPTGTYLRQWGSSGSDPGEFAGVEALDVDGAGHVWVADETNNRIQVFGPEGAFLGEFGSDGSDPEDTPAPKSFEQRGGRAFVASASADKIVAFDVCGGNSFTDLPTTSPFFDAVCWGTAVELVNGFSDGTFRGTQAVSRQAAAAYLYRLFDSPGGPFPDPGFTDVPSDHQFIDEISWMVEKGIASGFPDNTFRPTLAVSRQAMAQYLYTSIGSPPGPFPDPGFDDVADTSPFATAIAWSADAGITTGFADGGYHPTAAVSRQTMVQFLAELDGRFLHPPA